MKHLIAPSLLSLGLLALVGCSKVTLENYKKIEVGMDKSEVEAILGKPSLCEDKTIHTNCMWGTPDKHISTTLIADKVTLYSEVGL